MKCNKCGSPTAIVDTRPEGDFVRRKRICNGCLRPMMTIEKPEADGKVSNSGKTPIQKK